MKPSLTMKSKNKTFSFQSIISPKRHDDLQNTFNLQSQNYKEFDDFIVDSYLKGGQEKDGHKG